MSSALAWKYISNLLEPRDGADWFSDFAFKNRQGIFVLYRFTFSKESEFRLKFSEFSTWLPLC